MSMMDFIAACHKVLKEQNVPEPYEITLPPNLIRKLENEIGVLRTSRRRLVGIVYGFDVYVDDMAPSDKILFGGKR